MKETIKLTARSYHDEIEILHYKNGVRESDERIKLLNHIEMAVGDNLTASMTMNYRHIVSESTRKLLESIIVNLDGIALQFVFKLVELSKGQKWDDNEEKFYRVILVA